MTSHKPDDFMDVSRTLDSIRQLPSLPMVVMELLQSFDDENIDIQVIANKIARDQAIVAKLMRVANSPFFGLSGQISSITESIAMLGFNNLRSLVMAVGIINTFSGIGKHFDWKNYWRHNIAAAVCAKVLAKSIGLNAETAFTAGLLHDIGILIMAGYFPEQFDQLQTVSQESGIDQQAAERQVFGFDHPALGGEIAKRWHFPLEIQQAIGLHHTHFLPDVSKSMADVVYVANLFAHALENGLIREDQAAHLATVSWSRLKLSHETLDNLAIEAQRLFDGAVLLMNE